MPSLPPPFPAVDLSQGDEDPAESLLVGAFNDLINGKLDSPSAAKLVDQVITDECQKGFARYETASTEQKEHVDKSAIGGWLKYLYVDLIASGAMMVPAEHPAQDRLVCLVQEMNRLPRHTVPRVLPDGRIDQKEIWMIIPETDYDGFRQWLWEIIEGGAKPFGKPYDTKYYINLSAFIARMLATGTAAMLGFCALLDPFARRSLVTVLSKEPEKYAFRVVAAAQWILHAGEAIREMCEKRVMAGKRWTPELWDSLKTKFDTVAKDVRFTAEGCIWAAKARDRMSQLEQQVFRNKEGVVEIFRFDGPPF